MRLRLNARQPQKKAPFILEIAGVFPILRREKELVDASNIVADFYN